MNAPDQIDGATVDEGVAKSVPSGGANLDHAENWPSSLAAIQRTALRRGLEVVLNNSRSDAEFAAALSLIAALDRFAAGSTAEAGRELTGHTHCLSVADAVKAGPP